MYFQCIYHTLCNFLYNIYIKHKVTIFYSLYALCKYNTIRIFYIEPVPIKHVEPTAIVKSLVRGLWKREIVLLKIRLISVCYMMNVYQILKLEEMLFIILIAPFIKKSVINSSSRMTGSELRFIRFIFKFILF